LLSWVAPRFRFQSRIDPSHTTRNEAVLAARLSDELMHRSVTARWYFAMKSAMAAAWRDAAALTAPILVLQAGDDRIVDPAAPAQWLKRTAGGDQTLRVFEGHFHELHHEPAWREILSAAADWLEAHVPADAARTLPAVEVAAAR
jgi:lysophospholipase